MYHNNVSNNNINSTNPQSINSLTQELQHMKAQLAAISPVGADHTFTYPPTAPWPPLKGKTKAPAMQRPEQQTIPSSAVNTSKSR